MLCEKKAHSRLLFQQTKSININPDKPAQSTQADHTALQPLSSSQLQECQRTSLPYHPDL